MLPEDELAQPGVRNFDSTYLHPTLLLALTWGDWLGTSDTLQALGGGKDKNILLVQDLDNNLLIEC
jgi:hypothetical protein